MNGSRHTSNLVALDLLIWAATTSEEAAAVPKRRRRRSGHAKISEVAIEVDISCVCFCVSVHCTSTRNGKCKLTNASANQSSMRGLPASIRLGAFPPLHIAKLAQFLPLASTGYNHTSLVWRGAESSETALQTPCTLRHSMVKSTKRIGCQRDARFAPSSPRVPRTPNTNLGPSSPPQRPRSLILNLSSSLLALVQRVNWEAF